MTTSSYAPEGATEIQAPGTSAKIPPGPKLRRYMILYALASLGAALIWTGIGGIILPLHVQQISYSQEFTGPDAHADVQQLTNLKAKVDAGTVTPNTDQKRQLAELSRYNTDKASSLSTVDSVGVAITMLIQPLIGMLSDRSRSRWGRRAPWIASGAVLGTALFICQRYATSLGVLLVIWTLAQLAVNVAQGPLSTTVADRVPTERIGKVSGITGMCSSLGGTLGSLAAGMFFASIGLNTYFPFVLLFMIFMLLFVFFTQDTSSRDLQVQPLRLKAVLKSYGYALRFGDFRWAWIAKILLWIGNGIGTVYAIYMLQSYIQPALSASQAAKMAPVMSTVALPFSLLSMLAAGHLSDKLGRRKPFVIAASAIMAFSFLVPFVWRALPALFAQAIISGIGMGAFGVVDQALFIEALPEKESAGRDLGLATLGQNLGQALGPVVAGVVVSMSAGSYAAVWPAAFVLVGLAALAVVPIKGVR